MKGLMPPRPPKPKLPDGVRVCFSCGDQFSLGPNVKDITVDRHCIGFVWIAGVAHSKWCDGTET